MATAVAGHRSCWKETTNQRTQTRVAGTAYNDAIWTYLLLVVAMALRQQARTVVLLLLAGCVFCQPLQVRDHGLVTIQGGTSSSNGVGRKLLQTTDDSTGEFLQW